MTSRVRFLQRTTLCAALAAMGLATPQTAQAGVVITTVSHDAAQPNQTPRQGKIWLEGNNLRMREPKGKRGLSVTIFRGEEQVLWKLAPKQKRYHQIDQSTAKQLADRMRWARSRIVSGTGGMPPDQKVMLEEMLDRIADVPDTDAQEKAVVRTRATGKRQLVDGRPARQHELLRGKTKVGEIWVTDWDEVDADRDDLAALRALATFQRSLIDQIGPSTDLTMAQTFQVFDQVDGFPLVIRALKGDQEVSKLSFQTVAREEMPESRFQIPEGYTQGAAPGL